MSANTRLLHVREKVWALENPQPVEVLHFRLITLVALYVLKYLNIWSEATVSYGHTPACHVLVANDRYGEKLDRRLLEKPTFANQV
jgi:hypothetical protein